MDSVAREVLQLLLRGVGLRSDALSDVLDDIKLASAQLSSCELHVARYRGAAGGECGLHAGLYCPRHHTMQQAMREGSNSRSQVSSVDH